MKKYTITLILIAVFNGNLSLAGPKTSEIKPLPEIKTPPLCIYLTDGSYTWLEPGDRKQKPKWEQLITELDGFRWYDLRVEYTLYSKWKLMVNIERDGNNDTTLYGYGETCLEAAKEIVRDYQEAVN